MRLAYKSVFLGFVCFVLFFQAGSCYVAQADLELPILLTEPPQSWGLTGMCPHTQLKSEESRLSSVTWMGCMQSVEGLTSKDGGFPKKKFSSSLLHRNSS
jgi:hypothetical protein